MEMTKFDHSCVRLDKGGRALVIDPGAFSDAATALDGADGVLITHEHPDHVDVDAVTAAAGRNPRLRVWAPASVEPMLASLGDAVSVIGAGEQFDAAGFAVRTFGGQHALIHSSVPVVSNIACLIEGSLYHPGDSFTVPNVPVDTALIPIHAPWSRIGDVLDFIIALRARRAYQIHDALLNDNGLGVVLGHLRRVAGEYGSEFEWLETGTTTNVPTR